MLARRWTINLVLAAVLALLAVAVQLDLRETLRATQLTALSPAAIGSLDLRRAGEPAVRLRRDGAGWQMLAPFAVPADAAAVHKLLPVAQATLTRTLPAAGLELAALGLDPAPISITLDGLELRFGSTEPVADQRYVQVGDMVHLIDDRFLPRLMTPTLELISRRLLPPDFSPGLGDLAGAPLTAGDLAPLADAEAVRIETALDARDGTDSSLLLRIGSADGGDALSFLVSDSGTRWTRPDLALSWLFATAPLAALRQAPAAGGQRPAVAMPRTTDLRAMPTAPPAAPVPAAPPLPAARAPAATDPRLPTERLAPPAPGSEPVEQRPTAAIPNLRALAPERPRDLSALQQGAADPFAPSPATAAAAPTQPDAASVVPPDADAAPLAPLPTERRSP